MTTFFVKGKQQNALIDNFKEGKPMELKIYGLAFSPQNIVTAILHSEDYEIEQENKVSARLHKQVPSRHSSARENEAKGVELVA